MENYVTNNPDFIYIFFVVREIEFKIKQCGRSRKCRGKYYQ